MRAVDSFVAMGWDSRPSRDLIALLVKISADGEI
jgi:hypothetical protein